MKIDQDRSGHFIENELTLTYIGISCDISLQLSNDDVKELKEFLAEVTFDE